MGRQMSPKGVPFVGRSGDLLFLFIEATHQCHTNGVGLSADCRIIVRVGLSEFFDGNACVVGLLHLVKNKGG